MGTSDDQSNTLGLRQMIRDELANMQGTATSSGAEGSHAPSQRPVPDANSASNPSGASQTVTLGQVQEMIAQAMGRSSGNQNTSSASQRSGGSSNTALSLGQVQQMIKRQLGKKAPGTKSGQSSQSAQTSQSSSASKSTQVGNAGSGSSNASGTPSAEKGSGSNQSVWTVSSGASTSNSGNGSKKASVKPKDSQSQQVAEVLTQAQYELSQELEANLKKLRSVIQQSQEIAKKIEMVLGKGDKGSGKSE
jgi:hypothetical protein